MIDGSKFAVFNDKRGTVTVSTLNKMSAAKKPNHDHLFTDEEEQRVEQRKLSPVQTCLSILFLVFLAAVYLVCSYSYFTDKNFNPIVFILDLLFK